MMLDIMVIDKKIKSQVSVLYKVESFSFIICY